MGRGQGKGYTKLGKDTSFLISFFVCVEARQRVVFYRERLQHHLLIILRELGIHLMARSPDSRDGAFAVWERSRNT